MSEYQDLILLGDPDIHLPLEEDSATPLVNVGVLGANVSGSHIDVIPQQENMVYQQLFSMRYPSVGVSNCIATTPMSINKMRFWVKLDELTETVFTFSLSTDPTQLFEVAFVNGLLSITVNGVTRAVGDAGSTGGTNDPIVTNRKYWIYVYDTGSQLVILKDSDPWHYSSVYASSFFGSFVFDTFDISTVSACYAVDAAGNVLTDASGNPLQVTCVVNTLTASNGDVLQDASANTLTN